MVHEISIEALRIPQLETVASGSLNIRLSAKAEERIARCRTFLDSRTESGSEVYYGINTGFGSLYNRTISNDDLGKLQVNLMMSHACGMGEEVQAEIVRLMLFLKVQGLSYGNSGVQVDTVRLLAELYNNDILPVVYQLGSLGASGDLAPLAHLCLPLIGMGEVRYKGRVMPAADALSEAGLQAVQLRSKEGLALLNGTQFMSACGCWALIQASRLERFADLIASVSLDAFDGRIEPFHASIHAIRPHPGQISTAGRFRNLLHGSNQHAQPKQHVKDPYAFSCIPQVHCASKDAIQHVSDVLEREVNAVTDNPTVFPDEELIISAGNFHGQPLALALDYLAIALAELGSISERRTYQLISGQRGLPPFLVANAGLDSGFMIPQYTAASIVSQNKQLCTPASVDSIVSSNGQEDHVSMGANAATKLLRVVDNLERILAIELMNASQALSFRAHRSSTTIEAFVGEYRNTVPLVQSDRILFPDLRNSVAFLRTFNIDSVIPNP
ncbi:MAG: histidine ammonia-lyase [Bacteroidota bacterium]